jgi:branched-chain amino acid transport system permease protein
MDALLHQLLAGLATGGIYASVALALVMIYQSTHHINFAQGEMAMFSTFIAWILVQAGLPYWIAFAATIALSFVLAAVVEVAVIRPMQDKPVLSVVVVFIGLLMIFHSLAGWLFGYTIKQFPSPFPSDAWYGGTLMSAHEVGSIGVTVIMVGLLFSFLRFTPLGLAMRAAAENAASARLVGIDVGRMLMLGWGLAGAIGAVAGMMVAPVVFLDPHMMTGVLLYAFAGALIGGIDSPIGAVLGGLLVGVLENLVGTYVVGTELKLSVALVLIVGVLIVKPSGLLGRTVVTRV